MAALGFLCPLQALKTEDDVSSKTEDEAEQCFLPSFWPWTVSRGKAAGVRRLLPFVVTTPKVCHVTCQRVFFVSLKAVLLLGFALVFEVCGMAGLRDAGAIGLEPD